MARVYRSKTVRSVLRDLERKQRIQGTASTLARSGLSVPDEGVTAVDGDFQSESFVAGSAGWRLQAGGNAEFNDLTLRGGIIGNDALSNPVKPGTLYAYVTNFSLSTSFVNILTQTVTVPDGFTTAHVMMAGRVFAYNNTAGLDYLYGQTNIAGFNGWALPLAVSGSGGSGTNSNSYATVLPGLSPGSTFTVQIAAKTSFAAWSADPGNTAEVSGSITWYR